MSANRADLTVENGCAIRKGANWDIILTILDKDGNPLPLAGYYDGRCQIRKTAKVTDTAILAAPTITFPTEINGIAVVGKMRLSLTAAETDSIPTTGVSFLEPSKYIYDVELVRRSDEYTSRPLEGFVYIVPGVTRNV